MKKMVKAIAVFLLTPLLHSCSHKEYAEGTYQDSAITADGDLSEWNLPLRFGSNTGLVQYNITNDNENIYVSMQTHDEATAIKILRAGVNVYIDPAAGHSKKMDIAFPLPAAAPTGNLKNNTGNNARPDRSEMRNALLIQTNTFKTTGFENLEDRIYDVSDKSNLKLAIKFEADNSLCYEAIIPLKFIYKNSNFINEKNKNISVAVQVNAMPAGRDYSRQGNSNNTNYGSGMRGNGGSRRSGMSGGMSGGGRRGGNYNSGENSSTQQVDRTTLNKADVNWYSFKMAFKNKQ